MEFDGEIVGLDFLEGACSDEENVPGVDLHVFGLVTALLAPDFNISSVKNRQQVVLDPDVACLGVATCITSTPNQFVYLINHHNAFIFNFLLHEFIDINCFIKLLSINFV